MIALDFETYFNTKDRYGLKPMTTEAYVRDPRLAVICLGWADDNGKSGWVAAPNIPAWLSNHDWTQTDCLCHNAHFDGAILSHHYNVHPRSFACTLAMAHECYPEEKASLELLAAKFGWEGKSVPYKEMDGVHPNMMGDNLLTAVGLGAEQDCLLTRRLYDRLLEEGFPGTELPIVSITAQMFTDPQLVGDATMFRALQKSELDKREALFQKLGTDAKALGSPKQFQALLEAQGVEIEYKTTKTGNTIPAFAASDEFMHELSGAENEIVAQLAEARILTKSNIRATRAGRLAETAERGPLPVFLYYYGATRTGRWSGGDRSNWQNFPRSGELGEAVSAPEGHTLVICDAAQIEYRILCAVAGEEWPLDAFVMADEDPNCQTDPYTEVASSIFGRLITIVDKDERFFGKKTVLASGYGISGPTLYKRLKGEGVKNITPELAQQAVDAYRDRHPMVQRMWKEAATVLYWLNTGRTEVWKPGILSTKDHALILPNGAHLKYRMRWDENERTYYRFDRRSGPGGSRLWGSAFTGETIQSLARVFLSDTLLRIQRNLGLRPVCLRHDEAVYVVAEEEANLMRDMVEKEFRRPPEWLPSVPLNAECWVSKTYTKPPKKK